MAYITKTAPIATAALLLSTVAIAGPAQVTPIGDIQVQPMNLVGTPQWYAQRRVALAQQSQPVLAKSQPKPKPRLCVGVSGLVTTPELHLEDLAERGTGCYRF